MAKQEQFSLEGMTVLVTGGAHHLGYQCSLALAEAGARVALTSRDLAGAEKAAADIAAASGRETLPLKLDLLADDVESEVERTVGEVIARFGGIDILVNNAGNFQAAKGTTLLEERPLDLFRRTIELNITGTFLCTKEVVRRSMLPRRSGRIINMGSTTGLIGKDRRVYQGTQMSGTTLDYHAAKGAIIAMTRELAVYLAPQGVRVNCVSPSAFYRPGQPEAFLAQFSATVPMGRLGRPEQDLKGCLVFLASEASGCITGQNIIVDGGLTAW